MQESLVCVFLDLPIDDENTEDIPDFDIQTKLQELLSCADGDTFQDVLMNSLKDIQWVLPHLFFICPLIKIP